MRKIFPTVGAAALLTLTLAACATDSDKTGSSPDDGKPVVLVPDTAPSAFREAEVDGAVELRDGCFVLVSAKDSWLIEWPFGTTLGADEASVQNEQFGIVEVGNGIRGGGGYGNNVDGCEVAGVEGTVSIDEITETHTAQ